MAIRHISPNDLAKVSIKLVLSIVSALLLFCLSGCIATGPQNEIKSCLNDYTWDELSAISNELSSRPAEKSRRNLAIEYNLCNNEGDLDGTQTKEITLSDGTKTSVVLVGICEDTSAVGRLVGLTFMFQDIIDSKPMYEATTTPWTWEESSLRQYLNSEFASTLPNDMVAVVQEVKKKTEPDSKHEEYSIT